MPISLSVQESQPLLSRSLHLTVKVATYCQYHTTIYVCVSIIAVAVPSIALAATISPPLAAAAAVDCC